MNGRCARPEAELEAQLIAAPASTWEGAADKVRYLLSALQRLRADKSLVERNIDQSVLDDFSRLSRET